LATSKIYSISGKLRKQPLVHERPFRSPHHSISQAGLVGGGSYPQPGEISLAHNGILFLDELTEFRREALEAMRQPLENKEVSIARVHQAITFPASFLLVAALNPCPCGFLGDKKRACSCSPNQIARYQQKLSGPLLDRIDIQVPVTSVAYETVTNRAADEQTSATLAQGVKVATAKQRERFGSDAIYNSAMPSGMLESHCILSAEAEKLIKLAFEKLNLSMRGYHKTLKVARTIADLAGSDVIDTPHIQEAIMYRSLDTYLGQQRT